MKYELTTLKDIFDKLPANRIKPCLHELAVAMEQAKAMRELLNAAGNAISCDSVDIDFSWPETMTWIDDGKGTIDRLVMLFTCHYGLHDWTYFRMANSFIAAFPNDLAINRRCDRCGYMQCTDDGKKWVTRI